MTAFLAKKIKEASYLSHIDEGFTPAGAEETDLEYLCLPNACLFFVK